jgi:hypothetical protein
VADASSTTPRSLAASLVDAKESSLLDLVDNLLDKGVVLDAEIVLGLAGVDLIYLKVGALLCAADRVPEVPVS